MGRERVRLIFRRDRFGRGGDHIEFLKLGFPAARLTVAVENYNWQHQDVRVEKGVHYGDTIDHMDFPYLAKIAKLTVRAIRSDQGELAVLPGPGKLLRALMDRFPGMGPAMNRATGTSTTMRTVAEYREREARLAAAER